MAVIELVAQHLTRERFARFGDVVEASGAQAAGMNDARFERFDHLCEVAVDDDGDIAVSIVRARVATSLPYRVDMVERHPLGSQAFIPMSPFCFYVVVGAPAEAVDSGDLHAFVSNGRQGINYHRGTWHMPLIALETGQQFLVIDRAGNGPNCDQHDLDEPVLLVGT